MIKNRPKSLQTGKFYHSLPNLPVEVDVSIFPDLLKLDLFELIGLLPVTKSISDLSPEGIEVQPSAEVIRYYEKEKIEFAMISVVANCHHFEECEGRLLGKPYSLSLFPASKRGQVDYSSASSVAVLDVENLQSHESVYHDFDPFTGTWSLFGQYGMFAGNNGIGNSFTDSIGFVIGTYFLANKYNKEEVLLTGSIEASPAVSKRYRRWRINHYFEQFTDLKPRRVWGAETPLELFLMQGLAIEGIQGIPQYLFFSNGEMHPSYHDMIKEDSSASETPVITEADLYFPTEKVAVFCDSQQFHRSKAAQIKDQRVVAKLNELGVTSVRVPSELIFEETSKAVKIVKTALERTRHK